MIRIIIYTLYSMINKILSIFACLCSMASVLQAQSLSAPLQQIFREADAATLSPTTAHRPVIGVTASQN
ncbi:MAG: hypothetical protein KIG57_09560, partial [Muribaculaceae bacterium]|nr:hypothetical protein [Muribaculaceae bacterium]